MYKHKKEDWKRADKIALLGVFTNVMMAAITIWAVLVAINASKSGDKNFADTLKESKKSADASVKAANVAESTLNVTKRSVDSSNANFLKSLNVSERGINAAKEAVRIADSSFRVGKKSIDISEKQFELAKVYSEKSDSNYLKSINIANNSLATAQRSFIATQNNFEIQNRAYVILSNVQFDTIRPFRITNGGIVIKNFGKTPALILNSVIGYSIDTTIRKERIYTNENIKFINFFLPENGDYGMPFNFQPMENDLLNLVVKNKIFIIVYGEILFQDIVTSKLYSYIFSIRLMQNGRFAPTIFNNSGSEIKGIDKWLTEIK